MNIRQSHPLFATAAAVALAVAATIVGCNAGDADLLPILGNVTVDGIPVDDGQIVFEPQGGGRMAAAPIINGVYEIKTPHGLPAGGYIVRITADRPTGRTAKPSSYAPDQTANEIMEQYLPPKYNSASELTANITQEAEAKHDFALTLK